MTADSVVRKLTAMYTVLAVEQVLHEHKLASEPHMLENIEHPTRLIQSILESTHHDSSDRGKKVVLYGWPDSDVSDRYPRLKQNSPLNSLIGLTSLLDTFCNSKTYPEYLM